MSSHPGPFKGCYSVLKHPLKGPSRCAKRLDRGETLKNHFQTDAVASSWMNQSRDDRKSKTRPRNKPSDHQTNQSGRSKQKHTRVTGKYIPLGERDVILLRNPTEDKRADGC